MPNQPRPVHDSAKVYTPLVLRLYDLWVLGLSNAFAWCCSTKATLLPFFREHIGTGAHLDVGVGTGFYPSSTVDKLNKTTSVYLADLNTNTLEKAGARLRGAGYKGELETLEQDVFKPFPESMQGAFDSISLFYLFHCLPGTFPQKGGAAFTQLVPLLSAKGTLYGATILGKGVKHNWFGGYLMKLYNKKGIFGNAEDSVEGLRDALGQHFDEIEVRVVGMVALFVARRPKTQS